MLPITYCYFVFKHGDNKHDLCVWVTPSLALEWKLFINNTEVGTLIDEVTNVLIESSLSKALSYPNVTRVYKELLEGPPVKIIKNNA